MNRSHDYRIELAGFFGELTQLVVDAAGVDADPNLLAKRAVGLTDRVNGLREKIRADETIQPGSKPRLIAIAALSAESCQKLGESLNHRSQAEYHRAQMKFHLDSEALVRADVIQLIQTVNELEFGGTST